MPIHTRRGRRLDALGQPPPAAVGGVVALVAHVRHARPEHAARREHEAAGSSVSMASIATAIPSAPIGPRLAVLFSSATDSVSRAAITVMPDAKIAGPALRSARVIASVRSSCRRSSSR